MMQSWRAQKFEDDSHLLNLARRLAHLCNMSLLDKAVGIMLSIGTERSSFNWASESYVFKSTTFTENGRPCEELI